MKEYSAIALFSGGLDSMLCVLYMRKLGYKVTPIFFKSLFFSEARATASAKSAGFDIEVIDISDEHLEMLKYPKYGYGKQLNPCVDCHGLMFKKAGEMLKKYNADFIISGEVLGQRPMSQRMDSMNAVRKLSEVKDVIIRPLCQQLLPDTLPIKEGWVNKNEMLCFSGRGRKNQIKLAAELGLEEWQAPAGGCSLTDKNMVKRLLDLIHHDQLERNHIKYLQIGRHFRLTPKTTMIMGRDEGENTILFEMLGDDIYLWNTEIAGPLSVIVANEEITQELLKLAASLTLGYNKHLDDENGTIQYGNKDSMIGSLDVTALSPDMIKQYRIQ